MGLLSDLQVLYAANFRPIRGHDHASRLESFYKPQAHVYDEFRKNLLHGRQELWQRLPLPEQGVWVDLGCGTGSNLEYLGDNVDRLRKIYLVDLSPSLLCVAKRRVEEHGWRNVELVCGDATTLRPCSDPADVVTFSYSLTMIPDWYAAIAHAKSMLRPGGLIGVVDFYISRKHPEQGRSRHGWMTRTFWPWFFARDNVFLSPDHLAYLAWTFEPVYVAEQRKRIPYVPWLTVPYYQFLGRKNTPH